MPPASAAAASLGVLTNISGAPTIQERFPGNVWDIRRLRLSPQLPLDVRAAISRPARAPQVARDQSHENPKPPSYPGA